MKEGNQRIVSAFAPAGIGNVSAGFDCLGLALERPGDIVSIGNGSRPGAELVEIQGDAGELPRETENNIAGRVVQNMLTALRRKDALAIRLKKGMPMKSGLGSSAASAVAAALAANAFLGDPFSKEALLPFALEGERLACGSPHYDNVAASLFGGIVLIRPDDPCEIISLSYPKALYFAILHPDVQIATRDARAVLPDRVSRDVAVMQSSHLAAFIHALREDDWELIGRSMVDFIAEPVRKALLPYFDRIKNASLAAGACGFGISGSGPAMFALCRGRSAAESTASAMGAECSARDLRYETFVSRINPKGAEIIEEG